MSITPDPILKSNLEEAWAALSMVRETLELIGVPGSMPNGERCITFTDEAEAICSGIKKTVDYWESKK